MPCFQPCYWYNHSHGYSQSRPQWFLCGDTRPPSEKQPTDSSAEQNYCILMKKCNDDTTVLVQTPLRDCHVLLESLQDKRTKRQGVMLSYCGPQEKHVNKISPNGRHRSKRHENKSEAKRHLYYSRFSNGPLTLFSCFTLLKVLLRQISSLLCSWMFIVTSDVRDST